MKIRDRYVRPTRCQGVNQGPDSLVAGRTRDCVAELSNSTLFDGTAKGNGTDSMDFHHGRYRRHRDGEVRRRSSNRRRGTAAVAASAFQRARGPIHN